MQAKDPVSEPLSDEVVASIESLVTTWTAKHRQSALDGDRNIWMLKPGALSRGRGLKLSTKLDEILDHVKYESRWVCQKYIENPIVVEGKKFDMRQWVVVTSWQPLAVWFYEDCYLRFSFSDYNPKKLKKAFAHFTNNSISKKAKGFEECKDETMWDSEQFAEYLRDWRTSPEWPASMNDW